MGRRPATEVAESDRLAAVHRFDLLDMPPDPTFDRVTALAARIFDVPISIVSVVDHDRIWFKSRHGLDATETGRDPGLCASAILQDGPWVVCDAASDVRTLANPLVTGALGLRFYAGVPLTTSDGFNLGTLCVIDRQPRSVTDDELDVLRNLAAIVVDRLELRLAARVMVAQESELRRHAEELAEALQSSLLPPQPPVLPGMELATRYRPGERSLQVGGDFYDVFRIGTNDWGVVIGDACGRGARAASLTALARWTIRAAAVRRFRPATVLGELNAALLADAAPEADDHFCAAVFARVELDMCGAWVTLASAGHPRPVVVRRAGWIDVRGHVGFPLGLFDDAATTDDRVGLGPGDALVFVTDGITEARSPHDELFGDEAMPELLLDCCGLPAETIADRLIDAANAFSEGDTHDDVAVVVLRVPEDTMADPLGRVTRAIGVAPEELELPGYPLGDVQPDLWRQPPDPPREARIRLAPEPRSVGVLRQLIGRLLASWRLDDLVGGDVDLLASEVATNAVLHAATPLTVIVNYLGPVIRVEVGDGSLEVPRQREAGEEDLGGRGMLIVEALARRWGVVLTRTGKRVWFEMDTQS